MDENVNLLEINPDIIDHIRSAVAEAYEIPEFQIRFNPQNKFYYIFINDHIEPIPINILTGAPLEESLDELGVSSPDSLFDINYIKRSNNFNEDYIVHEEFIPDTLFDTDYLDRSSNTTPTKVISRYGTHGQRWGHRYHQSYRVKPRRSGKMGEEHSDAKRQSERIENKATHNESKTNNNESQAKEKNIISKTIDSAKSLYNDYQRKKTIKQIKKNNKLRKKYQKLQLKNQEQYYKQAIQNQKQVNKLLKKGKTPATVNYTDNKTKMQSLMADSPKVIMKKWKGKLDNNDLKYLKQRMGLETHINNQINPPFDFAKAYRNVSMVGRGLITANNVMADFYNSVNANEINNGTTKPWPSTRVYSNNNSNKKKKNKGNYNRR